MTECEYKVTGMSCAGCAARVEKSVAALPGVAAVMVSLPTASMVVRGEGVESEAVVAAVRRLGFGAEAVAADAAPEPTAAVQAAAGARRALGSLLLALPLVAVHLAYHGQLIGAWLQLALVLPIVWLNRAFFIKGVKALWHGGPSMDTLVALGSGVALADGAVNLAMGTPGEVYFESAGMILAFVSVGKWLEGRATQRTGRAVEKLAALLPATATLLRNGSEAEVPTESLHAGDLVLVRPGERIPVDGAVVQGVSCVDEAALTGESMPVDKSAGAEVYAGTVNGEGALRVRVTRSRADYALSAVIRLVRKAAAEKAPMARLADRLAAVFVPLVLALACGTAVVWGMVGDWDFALTRAVAVLVISCPCALGLATPVAIMAGAGRGAEWGVLFRSGRALEAAGRADCVVLDKTGTLTVGKPVLTDVLPAPQVSRDELLAVAAAVETDANHPLAAAIRREASDVPYAGGHIQVPGRGVRARVQGVECAVGNAALMRELGVAVEEAEGVSAQGKTLLYVARGGAWMGTLALADAPRPTAAAAVRALGAAGLRVLMLTGDHLPTAQAIAADLGVREVHADALPADKANLVRSLQSRGEHVAMVGDGINDAPALVSADVGIAIGAGTDVAMESAGIVLMRSDPMDIVRAVALSRAIVRKIRQNLFLALVYNVLAIPLAAGVFYPICGLLLPPVAAAAAMGMSSISVVLNALRLRKFTC